MSGQLTELSTTEEPTFRSEFSPPQRATTADLDPNTNSGVGTMLTLLAAEASEDDPALDALVELVRALQQRLPTSPLFFAIDDAEVLDPFRCSILSSFLRRVPMLSVICGRSQGDHRPPRVFASLSTQLTSFQHLSLSSLSTSHCKEFVCRRLLCVDCSSDLLQLVSEKSQNVPAFIDETLQVLLSKALLKWTRKSTGASVSSSEGRALTVYIASSLSLQPQPVSPEMLRLVHSLPELACDLNQPLAASLTIIPAAATIENVISGRLDALSPGYQLLLKMASCFVVMRQPDILEESAQPDLVETSIIFSVLCDVLPAEIELSLLQTQANSQAAGTASGGTPLQHNRARRNSNGGELLKRQPKSRLSKSERRQLLYDALSYLKSEGWLRRIPIRIKNRRQQHGISPFTANATDDVRTNRLVHQPSSSFFSASPKGRGSGSSSGSSSNLNVSGGGGGGGGFAAMQQPVLKPPIEDEEPVTPRASEALSALTGSFRGNLDVNNEEKLQSMGASSGDHIDSAIDLERDNIVLRFKHSSYREVVYNRVTFALRLQQHMALAMLFQREAFALAGEMISDYPSTEQSRKKLDQLRSDLEKLRPNTDDRGSIAIVHLFHELIVFVGGEKSAAARFMQLSNCCQFIISNLNLVRMLQLFNQQNDDTRKTLGHLCAWMVVLSEVVCAFFSFFSSLSLTLPSDTHSSPTIDFAY